MSGDKLPPPAHDCPLCGTAPTRELRHCDRPGCQWVTCTCGTKYELTGPHHYHPDDLKETP